MTEIQLKRAYDKAEKEDGVRILVDRLWPRGVSKEDAKLDHWLKELAPSDLLRKSFHNGDDSYSEFREKYKKELTTGEQEKALDELKQIVRPAKRVTIVFAAKDEKENNAVVIKELL
jgi:uncharacterized protein YeaO (DUF488 family)